MDEKKTSLGDLDELEAIAHDIAKAMRDGGDVISWLILMGRLGYVAGGGGKRRMTIEGVLLGGGRQIRSAYRGSMLALLHILRCPRRGEVNLPGAAGKL